MDKQINISIKTLFVGLLMALGVYVIYRLGTVIGILLIAVLIVISLEPLVRKLTNIVFFNKPISRNFAVIISYLLFILVLIFIGTVGIPPVFSQLEKLVTTLPTILSKINFGNYINLSISDFLPQASKISSQVLTVTFSVLSNMATLVTLIILSIYLSLDWVNIKKQFISLFPDHHEDSVTNILNQIELNVSYWVKGELTLMTIVGLGCFAGLEILGVKYALALGILSGVLEIVPMLGPIFSALLAAIIAFADAPIKGLGVIALYIIVQQLENNILVPKIMQKVSGFSPIVILLALLVGGEFFGIIGAVLAVPMTIVITVILKKVLRSSD